VAILNQFTRQSAGCWNFRAQQARLLRLLNFTLPYYQTPASYLTPSQMSKRSERADLGPTSGLPSSSHTLPTLADASVKLETSPSSGARNKRRASGPATSLTMSGPSGTIPPSAGGQDEPSMSSPSMGPPAKKSRTNTPWTPAEEQRLKTMRDAGNSWADIAKVR
jgi:hypothetical protein